MQNNSNWGLFGHEWAVDMLRSQIRQQQIRHAYLITGPQAVGRRTLALAFAQSLNCPQPTAPGEPCGTCSTCQRIHAMAFPDLTITQAEQAGGVLKVEQVRELQHSLALTPYEGRYRVAIILRMEEAHPSASNALLKTLEEPNPQVVLVLTASDAEALLPTIVSRCEVLRLRPITANLLSQSLQTHLKYPPSEADFLASISNGRPGYALYLRDNQGMLDQRKEWLGDLLHLLSANRVERYAYAESHTPDPRKDREKEREKLRILIQHILPLWISLWRDVLLQVLHDSAALSNPDFQAQTNALANSLNQEKVHLLIRQTEQTLANLKRNVNPKLAMEVLLLDLPHLPQAVFA